MKFTKEELEALGIDASVATELVQAYKDRLKEFVPKTRLDEVISVRDSLQAELAERDAQLDKLSKIDADGLKQQIEDLKAENEKTRATAEKALMDQRKDTALKLALVDKVHDYDLTSKALDLDKISVDEEGKISGLDEQLKALQTTKSFLFVPEEQPKPKGKTPADSTGRTTSEHTSFGASLAKSRAEQLKQANEASSVYFAK